MKLSIPTVLLCCFCCSAVSAQMFAVSPNYEKKDASGAEQLAGLRASFHQQFLLAAWRLVGLAGKELTGISFRRDSGNTDAFKGGSAKLVIQLSKGPTNPAAAAASFASNQLTTPMTVFSGTVVIPTSPAVTSTGYKHWGPKNAINITFNTPYKYPGGPLCIDIVGTHPTANGTGFWFIDFELDPNGGKVTEFGNGCTMKSPGFPAVAYASAPELRIGSTARLIALGRSGTSAVLALGVTSYREGKSLAAMQAPGCFLYVEPAVVVAAGAYATFPYPGMPAYLNVTIRIPPTRSLMGSRAFVQFANNETLLPASSWTNAAGMTTTNGLDLTISSVQPKLGMSMVRSHAVDSGKTPPARGYVDVSQGPVLRFAYR